MTPEQLITEARKLLSEATPAIGTDGSRLWLPLICQSGHLSGWFSAKTPLVPSRQEAQADAEFIAFARNHMGELLDLAEGDRPNAPQCKCGRTSPYGNICSECWKSEYENVCKFATGYESQRDELKVKCDQQEDCNRRLSEMHARAVSERDELSAKCERLESELRAMKNEKTKL